MLMVQDEAFAAQAQFGLLFSSNPSRYSFPPRLSCGQIKDIIGDGWNDENVIGKNTAIYVEIQASM